MMKRIGSLRYVRGDATEPQGEGRKLIVHVVNDCGAWGAGFTAALDRKWPVVGDHYRMWRDVLEGGGFYLGAIRHILVTPDITVVHLLAQKGLRTREGVEPRIMYGALGAALMRLRSDPLLADGAIHMPRIGCGLGGGDWAEVEPLLQQHLVKAGRRVTVYDWP